MSDRTGDRTPEPDDRTTEDRPIEDLAAVEAALSAALVACAGDPLRGSDDDAAGPMPPADDERFAAIEASVASTGAARPFRILGVAAAVLVVLLVGSLVLTRSGDDTEVRAGDDTTTSTEPDPSLPGTSTTPGPTETVPETVAPVDTTAPPQDDGNLADIDPRNFTYPAWICTEAFGDNGPLPGTTVTLVDGTVRFPAGDARSLPHVVDVHGVAHGDVTGDGLDDVLVTMRCALDQSDGVWPSVVVISEVDGTPTVLGAIAHSGFEDSYEPFNLESGTTYGEPPSEAVVSVAASGGRLRIRWNQNAGMGMSFFIDQRETTVTYEWDGQTFVPIGESDVVVIPATGYQPPTYVPVDDVDFDSLTLTLDKRMRVGNLNRVACGRTFADVQPVDAQLVDGAAVVRDEAGNELGSIAIERVEFADLADTDLVDVDLLEALVRIRCVRGASSTSTLAVFMAVQGPPSLLWSTTDANGMDDVVDVQLGVDGACPMTITYGSSDPAQTFQVRVSYRYELPGFVPDGMGCDG